MAFKDNNSSSIETQYIWARFVIGVLDIFGTILCFVGSVWFAFTLLRLLSAMADGGDGAGLFALLGLGPSFGAALAGFLTVAHSQLVRATLDSADCQREILTLARNK